MEANSADTAKILRAPTQATQAADTYRALCRSKQKDGAAGGRAHSERAESRRCQQKRRASLDVTRHIDNVWGGCLAPTPCLTYAAAVARLPDARRHGEHGSIGGVVARGAQHRQESPEERGQLREGGHPTTSQGTLLECTPHLRDVGSQGAMNLDVLTAEPSDVSARLKGSKNWVPESLSPCPIRGPRLPHAAKPSQRQAHTRRALKSRNTRHHLHKAPQSHDPQRMHIQVKAVFLQLCGVVRELPGTVGEDEPSRGRPIPAVAGQVAIAASRAPRLRIHCQAEVHQAELGLAGVPISDMYVARGDVAVIDLSCESLDHRRELGDQRGDEPADTADLLKGLARRRLAVEVPRPPSASRKDFFKRRPGDLGHRHAHLPPPGLHFHHLRRHEVWHAVGHLHVHRQERLRRPLQEVRLSNRSRELVLAEAQGLLDGDMLAIAAGCAPDCGEAALPQRRQDLEGVAAKGHGRAGRQVNCLRHLA
mmetsp:Transcript_69427/g.201489  ORF Transcript_69427/g.201489 Transcript_69427/m.201489 type:complete len:480 (-) Transcript_69427:35-1474(-)